MLSTFGRRLRAPRWVLALAGIVVGFVAVLGVLAVPRLSAARHQLAVARSALEASRSAVASRDVGSAGDALTRVDAALDRAGAHADGLPLKLLSPVPLVGSPVKALSAGLRAGHEAVAAGTLLNEAVRAFNPAAEAGTDGHDVGGVHEASAKSTAALHQAAAHLAAARKALSGPAGALLPPVSTPAKGLLRTLDSADKQLAGAQRGLSLLSTLTGPEADFRLLLLSQDTMELRATGGFVGSFGVFRFDHGTVALERYAAIDVLPDADPPVEAPDGLAQSLARPWDISNANWWPDFPTSARAAMDLYARQGGGQVDGVIAVTEDVMADLVGAVGPITLPGYAEPVTREGFAERVLYEIELKVPQDNPRKKFLIELADEVFHRLFALPADKLPEVATALGQAGSAGDIQVYFADPALQAGVVGTILDGALPAPKGDFLELVDSNLTASKANARLVRTVTYTVRPDGGTGRPSAVLDVDYANNGPASEVNPYYNGLLRVYVPKGTTLSDDSEGDLTPAEDGPYDVITTAVYVEPLGKQHVHLEYTLPETVAAGGRYHLTWLRQPGTPADSLTAVVGSRTFTASAVVRRFDVSADL